MPKVDRFVIFELDAYAFRGGWHDKVADVPTVEKAVTWLCTKPKLIQNRWFDLLDLDTGHVLTIESHQVKRYQQDLVGVITQCLKARQLYIADG